MVIEGLMGSAWAAYTYNQGRFQFDSGQQQTSAHQMMNMRIQQWSLFREDIRDLFNLTTSHMSTYMVVGTLFLGFSVSFMWSGIGGFPLDPPWLKLIWMNCFISAMCYGFLAVWLAMHGAIAAQSASVQLLTRAIRPPYPSAEELQRARHELSEYEAAGPAKFFRPPKLAARGAEATGFEGDGTCAEGPGVSPWNAAPGLSAELGSHVKLFQQLQATFLPFDAYARVCLMAGAGHLIPALSYFWIAHQPASQHASVITACTGSFLLMFCMLVLSKLDLYVQKRRLRYFKWVVLSGPLASVAAVVTWHKAGWSMSHALLEWLLVCGTCLMHMSWTVLFVWEARPSKDHLDLPLSFRSVRYLDVFNGLRQRQAARQSPRDEAETGQSPETAHLSADLVMSFIEELLTAQESQRLLSEEEASYLRDARSRLLASGMPIRQQIESSEGIWLERACQNDVGQLVFYFVHTKTRDVLWTSPAETISFPWLQEEVEKLFPHAAAASFEALELEEQDSPVNVPTLRRPGSSHGQSSLPWKYFLQIAMCTLLAWLVTTLYCMATVGQAPRAVQLLQRPPFPPKSFTCDGVERPMVADQVALEPHGTLERMADVRAMSFHEGRLYLLRPQGVEVQGQLHLVEGLRAMAVARTAACGGQVAVLGLGVDVRWHCMVNGTLRPTVHVAQAEEEVLAVGIDGQQLWLLGEELRREDLVTGEVHSHPLPLGRRWAAGICVGAEKVILAAYHHESRRSELWQVDAGFTSRPWADLLSRVL